MLHPQRRSALAEADPAFDEKEPYFASDPPPHSPRTVLPDRRHLLQAVPFCGRRAGVAVNFPLLLIKQSFHIESDSSGARARILSDSQVSIAF